MSDDVKAWDMLGRYVVQNLAKRKGVVVPAFGTFTLTTQVNLEGINPALTKDRDDRQPVFIVSNELAPGVRSGIAHESGIRPYSNKGVSGNIPVVKLNLAELAQLTGLSKDESKKSLDLAIRKFSENVKKGDCRVDIPSLGSLICKNQIVAVIFKKSLVPELPPGALTQDGERWLKSQLGIDLNNSQHENSYKRNISPPNNDFKESRIMSRPSSASHLNRRNEEIEYPVSPSTRSELKMKTLSSNFMKLPSKDPSSTPDFILDNESKLRLIFSLKDPGGRGLLSQEEFIEAIHMLENSKITESSILSLINLTGSKSSNKIHYNIFLESLLKLRSPCKRPASSVRSDYTGRYNSASTLPFARQIWEKRVEFTKHSQEGGMRPRVLCSASELLSILKKTGVNINIHQLKAVLRECGFNQASPLDLIRGVRNLLTPGSSDVSVFSEIASQASSWAPVHDENMEVVKKHLKDFNLQEYYRKASRQNGVLELDDFVEYITQQSRGNVRGFEAEHAFRKASKGRFVISESEFCQAFHSKQERKNTEKSPIEKVKNWLMVNRLSAAQGFSRLLESVFAVETLNKENFLKAVKKLAIDGQEAEVFFKLLDSKGDGKIDLAEWKAKVYAEDEDLNEMRETIMSYGLDPNEILMKMDLRGKTRLSVEELCEALMKVDKSLNSKKAVEIARSLTGLNSDINVNQLIEKISTRPDDGWINHLFDRIRSQGNFELIKRLFEDVDQRCMGKVDISLFAEVVNKAGLGLSISEIDRLARHLNRGMNLIDYLELLEQIRPRIMSSDPFKSLISRFLQYLRQNSLSPEDFLRKHGGRLSVQKFSEFLALKVQKDLSRSSSLTFAQRFDVNEDGWVDITDLMTTLDKGQAPVDQPVLGEEKAGLLLDDLRKVFASKRMSYQEAFNFFDNERNGLISCKEFVEGLEKLCQMSEPMRVALFHFIDKQKVGLINFETFSEILKYSSFKTPKTQDSWDWENQALDRIRAWILKENVTIEEAFRAFDKDFDGVLSQEDLKKSLVAILKYSENDVTVNKVERLYKLLDIYKRDSVQLADFKTIFEEKRNPSWKDSAKQSLGLFVSKNYETALECFEEISGHKERVTFEQFSKWLAQTRVLISYRLTQQLMQELFAYLDPHKKGFLSRDDWELCLGTFSYSSNCLSEVKDAIRSNFADIKTAFDYFLSFHSGPPPEKISLKDFEKALEAIIPKRFNKKELSLIWKQIFSDSSFISFREFRDQLDLNRFMSSFSGPRSKPSSARTFVSSSSQKSSLSEDPLKRLQALIRASPYSIEDIFREMDSDNSGTLSLIEFRNAMRKLNIGLSAKDIDGLLARIDTNNDGQIDWQEFQKQFKSSETETHIKSSCQQRLNFLRSNMNHFMLSARDAFNQFDPERSGRLTFNNFTALVQRISELAREPAPAFPVIKDLFDIIDIRKDGVLDMREWLNTFKEAEKNSWEDSKQFEEICRLISKNRKMLLDTFEQVGRNGRIEFEKAREVVATGFGSLKISEEQWRKVLGVAFKEGLVDYRMLLDIYKQRCTSAQQHPR
jgi:Ca2+-binding EF-hand superfamily protein/nucleoid DNA-binding protein